MSVDCKTAKIFNSAQETSACHQKNSILLRRQLEQDCYEKFIVEFRRAVEVVLHADHKSKNIYAERMVDFISMFCSSYGTRVEDKNMFESMIQFFLNYVDVVNDSVRFWACRIIVKIFETVEEISDQLYSKIRDAMMERLKDPKAVIRLQAILWSYRFQEPDDKHDPIITHFIGRINQDVNSKVRRFCVEKITVRKDTLPCLIDRTRDIDVYVRLESFKKLNNFLQYLKISQRRTLLTCGILDSSEKITNFISGDFVNTWLEMYEFDYIKMLRSIRLDASDVDIDTTNLLAEFILRSLFRRKELEELVKVVKLNEQKVIEFEDLDFETALYWRVLVQYIEKEDDSEEVLSLITPELKNFCEYIRRFYNYVVSNPAYFTFLQYQFILKQLFLIVGAYDVSDSCGRQAVNSLIADMFEQADLSHDVAEVMISHLERTIDNTSTRCLMVCEIISNIAYDTNCDEEKEHENKINNKISEMKENLSHLKAEQEMVIKEEKYLLADKLEKEICQQQTLLDGLMSETQAKVESRVEKRSDIPTILKYLTIAQALLKSPKVKELNAALQTLKTAIIQDVLVHPDDNVKTSAFTCYALCCIVDESTARYGLHIFSTPIFAYQVGEECNSQVLVVCMSALVDLLLVYGPRLMASPEENDMDNSRNEEHLTIFMGGVSLTQIIRGFADLMDDEIEEVEETAVKCLCKLLLNNIISSPALLARLILKWASPISDKNTVKQYIGKSLEGVLSLPDCLENFEEAIVITIQTLMSAPDESPLGDVNVESIAKFLLAVCQASFDCQQVHLNLAYKFCYLMAQKPKAKVNLIFSKMLLMLNIDKEAEVTDLLRICDELRDNIFDKQANKNIIKFASKLAIKEVKTTLCDINEEIEEQTVEQKSFLL